MLQGSYCHQCGQRRLELQRPIISLCGELVRETFDVDGRMFRSLRTLITQPGVLSQTYLAGKRQAYTPPLRLYLVVSLLFFLFVAWLARKGLLFEVTPNTTDTIRVLAEQLPRLMFFCLPVFALLLKILHFRRFYIDHLIHALHLHAAAYIALLVILPFERIADESRWLLAVQLSVFTYMIIYLTVSQRRVYATTWPKALIKTGLLFFAYSVLLGTLLELANSFEAAGGLDGL